MWRAAGRGRCRRPAPNQVWAYDFVFDACANGQQLKCLTVVDEYTRECLAIDVAGSIRSGRVIEVLAKLVSVHGAPRYLRSDNGPEFVSRAILRWLGNANIETAHIDPGKPWQNGPNESFNGKFRDECLSMEWFKNRIDAKIVIEDVPARLQRGPTALEPRAADAGGVQTESFNNQPGPSHFLRTSGPKNAGRSRRHGVDR